MISELTGVRMGHSIQTLCLTLRLKTDKCCLCFGGPMEGLKGGCQACKRSHYLAVVPNVHEQEHTQHVPQDIIHECLEVSGIFVKPNSMSNYLKCPKGVLNSIFHSFPWWIRMSFIKNWAFWWGLKAVSIIGRGYLFLTNLMVKETHPS